MNKAVISLLELRAERHKKKKAGRSSYDDLDALVGSWSKQEAAEFDKVLAAQRTIDPEPWK